MKLTRTNWLVIGAVAIVGGVYLYNQNKIKKAEKNSNATGNWFDAVTDMPISKRKKTV